MPSVPLKTMNFPVTSGVINGNSALDISWSELVWAAISVGKGTLAHMIQHGQFSMFEIVYRGAMVYANLLESPIGSFGRSSAYDGLDPSEKSAISYFLGLTLTKAFVAKRMGVPWLMHVDVYRDQFGVDLLAAGGRPDLFGEDQQGRWIVAESKGRTNGHDSEALIKAKHQASQVVNIGGVPPFISMGLVASFIGGKLSLVADDPPPIRTEGNLEWKVSREQFRTAYYQPFKTLFEEFSAEEIEYRGRRIRAVRSDSSDLTIGLDERIAGIGEIRAGVFADAAVSGSEFLGIDGIYVKLGASWEDGLMRLEPQTRQRHA